MRFQKNGFTLIEIAVAMVVIGILMAGVFRYLELQQTKKREDTTNTRVDDGTSILAAFSSKFDGPDAGAAPDQRLPCPSNPNLYLGQAAYGVEQCPSITAPAGTVFNGVRVAVNPVTGNRVFIGAFPTSTMGAKGDNSVDGFNQKLLYAVSANLTVAGSVTSQNPVGDVVINVDGGGTKNDAPFVIISTGRNGTSGAGTGATGDNENLDGDHIFSAFTGHSTASNPNYYDDEAAFQLGKVTDCTPSKLDVQEFKTIGSHTWTKPAGFQYAVVEIRGADGGPGSCRAGRSMCGSTLRCSVESGGFGGYSKTLISDINMPASVPVNIGAGGAGGCTSGGGGGVTGCTTPSVTVNESLTDGMIYSGHNGGNTSFGGAIINGGQGAGIASSPSRSTQGGTGSGSGADFYTSASGIVPIAGNGYVAPPEGTFSSSSSACSGSDWSWNYIYGGKGSDGYVLVTSYICQ